MRPSLNNLKEKVKKPDIWGKYRNGLKKWLLNRSKKGKLALWALLAVLGLMGATYYGAQHFYLAQNQKAGQSVFQTTENNQSVTKDREKIAKEKIAPATVPQKKVAPAPVPAPVEAKPMNLDEIGLPVTGKVLLAYNEPYYDQTYDEYHFNNGIKIQGQPGDGVKAAYQGQVCAITSDPIRGFDITIKHSSGYKTAYQGLSTVTVVLNQQVEKGDVVGNLWQKNHWIDFILTFNGEPINPLKNAP